jgi:hypothetical protein
MGLDEGGGKMFGPAAAILFGSVLISIAVTVPQRWTMSAEGGQVYRLDRWTGEIARCRGYLRPSATDIALLQKGRVTITTFDEVHGPGASDNLRSVSADKPRGWMSYVCD